ncbi:abortive infection family protein [Corynebacterium camporealensis]
MVSREISPRTFTKLRQMLTNSTVGAIEDAFRDEGFQPLAGFVSEDSSVRRATAEAYIAGVDWSDSDTPVRLARAIETLLEPFAPGEVNHGPNEWNKFVRLMEKDGWTVTEQGEVIAPVFDASLFHFESSRLTDPSGIQEQIARLRQVQGDSPAVIGAAKELVEATAKALNRELNLGISSTSNFRTLVNQVEEALGLSPKSVHLNVDSEQPVKKILGGATNIVLNLNDLRNSHGTGHGPATARVGLYQRHADLAVNAAALWCQLAVDTFNDPHAPWRRSESQ